jgi:hypothetical protein
MYGAQALTAGAAPHVPRPSQTRACWKAPSTHLEEPHTTPGAYMAQPAKPSHFPVVPQLPGP